MNDRPADLTYHSRRSEQERRRTEGVTDPIVRHVHEQLARFHLKCVSAPANLQMVQG